MQTQEQATVLSTGYSWRSGWVILCDPCYRSLDCWKESPEEMDAAIERYRIRVDQSDDEAPATAELTH
jgi:hypothetical protein